MCVCVCVCTCANDWYIYIHVHVHAYNRADLARQAIAIHDGGEGIIGGREVAK